MGQPSLGFGQGNRVEWCSWLSRQSNTLKVSGSSPGSINFLAFLHISVLKGLIFFLFLYTEYFQFDIHCLALRVGFGYVESELRYESYANPLGCSISCSLIPCMQRQCGCILGLYLCTSPHNMGKLMRTNWRSPVLLCYLRHSYPLPLYVPYKPLLIHSF